MRRNVITVALFTVLATMAVSCQKDDVTTSTPESSVSKTYAIFRGGIRQS